MEADNIYSDSYGENKMSDCLIVMEDVLLLAFQQLLQNLNILTSGYFIQIFQKSQYGNQFLTKKYFQCFPMFHTII